MNSFNYIDAEIAIRPDIADVHRDIWATISRPGNWWHGCDRVAIAAEVRNARQCSLCATRKSELSPYGGDDHHDATTNLPAVAIDAVHRITTDQARIKREWITSLADTGVSDGHYVELLGIAVAVVSIDGFHRAMGLPLEALPQPAEGEPSGYRPPGAKDHGAYVASIAAEDLSSPEENLYDGSPQTGNVISAMSLVPDSVRMLKRLSGAHYLNIPDVANPASNGGRALTRSQIELTAGRVSSLSDCFY